MEEAVDAAADRLRFEAWQRAVHGETIPYFYQGEQVGVRQRRSDQLMTQLLRVLNHKFNIRDEEGAGRADLATQLAEKLARLSEANAERDAGEAD